MIFLIAAVFLGRLYGVSLTITQLLTVALTGMVASFAAPGVPHGWLLVVTPVVVAMGIPAEGVGLLIAVDAVPDLFATMLNVTGDLAAAAIVSRGVKGSGGDAVPTASQSSSSSSAAKDAHPALFHRRLLTHLAASSLARPAAFRFAALRTRSRTRWPRQATKPKGTGLAVHIGLNAVDPAHCEGWSGPLNAVRGRRERHGGHFQGVQVQADARCSRHRDPREALAAMRAAAKKLKKGDFFLLTYSGHWRAGRRRHRRRRRQRRTRRGASSTVSSSTTSCTSS